MRRLLCFTVAAGILAVAAVPTAAHAGPPWISIELPANPLDPATRGALFAVHSYHHGTPVPSPVACTAEGLVDGDRRTVTLTVEETSRAGVRAVRGDIPGDGTWMVVCVSRDQQSRATVLVDYSAAGEITRVRVPHRVVENGRWTVPSDVSARDIDAMLRERAQLSATGSTGVPLAAALLALALIPVGISVWRSGRRS